MLRLRPDRTQRLEALLLGAGPHLEPVLDIGTATNGDLLLVLPAPAVRLPALLEVPGSLTSGESVTVLVPLAQALLRLHAAGIAHGGVRAAAVVLDEDGSPSWTAPVSPTLLRKVGPTAFGARVAEDVDAFRSLVGALLGPAGAAVPAEDGLDALAVALFGTVRAEPVRLVRTAEVVALGTPARLLPAVPARAAVPAATERLAATVVRHVRGVRPRAWLALGGVTTVLVVALTLLPSGGSAPGAPAAPAAPAPTRSVTAAPTGPVAGRGLAPGAAVTALLTERERCLAAGSSPCLRRVDAVDSPVLDADLRAVQAGVAAVRVDRTRLRLTTASGGTALATAGTVTVLAIKDRNGWRLRDVVAEPPHA